MVRNSFKTGVLGRASALAVTAALGGSLLFGAAVPVPAYAADGTVTITSAQEGISYDAYCVFTADVDNSNNAANVAWSAQAEANKTELIKWLKSKGYGEWLVQNGYDKPDAAENPQNALEFIGAKIAESGNSNTAIAGKDSFAKQFGTWAKKNLASSGTANAGAVFTAPEGYYLLISRQDSLNGKVGTAPIWFPLGGSAITIAEKASTPTVDKNIGDGTDNAGDYEIGDTVPFKITATLPSNYDAYEKYAVKIVDTPSAGLAIDLNSVTVKAGADSLDGVAKLDGTKLVVEIADLKAAAPAATKDSKIMVSYTATLTKDAQTTPGANKNGVTYTFSNNPTNSGEGTQAPDPTIPGTEVPDPTPNKVYTYQFDLSKVDKHTKEEIPGAVFAVQNDKGEFYNTATRDWDKVKLDSLAAANKLTTNAQGVITVNGIASGTYTITEVEAADHYSKPADPITLTLTVAYNEDGTIKADASKVSATGSTALLDGNAAAFDATDGKVTLTVVNDKNVALAMTGAEGVGLGGAAVLAIGLGWYLVRRRKQEQQS